MSDVSDALELKISLSGSRRSAQGPARRDSPSGFISESPNAKTSSINFRSLRQKPDLFFSFCIKKFRPGQSPHF
jgi:hypothetical protein